MCFAPRHRHTGSDTHVVFVPLLLSAERNRSSLPATSHLRASFRCSCVPRFLFHRVRTRGALVERVFLRRVVRERGRTKGTSMELLCIPPIWRTFDILKESFKDLSRRYPREDEYLRDHKSLRDTEDKFYCLKFTASACIVQLHFYAYFFILRRKNNGA